MYSYEFGGEIVSWEKWNYNLRIIGKRNVGYNKVVKTFTDAKTVELFDVVKVERWKDGFFCDVIRENVNAGNVVLKELGFREIKISSEQIHLVGCDFFERNFPGLDLAGKVYNGHAYIENKMTEVETVGVLSHEIAHLFSYSAILAIVSGDDGRNKEFGSLRLGMTFFPRNRKPQETLYDAISELLTEMFANRIREISMRSRREEINERHPYYEYVKYFRKILGKIAGSKIGTEKLENDFLKDYITGSYSALKKVVLKYPKTAPYFAKMTHGESLDEIYEIVK
jgi:hypothetical protein